MTENRIIIREIIMWLAVGLLLLLCVQRTQGQDYPDTDPNKPPVGIEPSQLSREDLTAYLKSLPTVEERIKVLRELRDVKKKRRVDHVKYLRQREAASERARRKARIAAGVPALKHHKSRTHALRAAEAWWDGYWYGRRIRRGR